MGEAWGGASCSHPTMFRVAGRRTLLSVTVFEPWWRILIIILIYCESKKFKTCFITMNYHDHCLVIRMPTDVIAKQITNILLCVWAIGDDRFNLFRNVIQALSEGTRRHIPYRNSVLTRLLQDGLDGNSKTSLIVSKKYYFANSDPSLN